MTGKKKCEYAGVAPYKCSREVLPGNEHCIFHSEDIEGKKDKFNDEFWREFERQKEHEEIYDFSGFVFPGDISFEGKEFEKNALFWFAKFSGEADFFGAQFYGEADFRGAQFSRKRKSNFMHVQFSSGANFEQVQFSEETYFGRVQFSGKANFDNAHFSGEVSFNAQFSGGASFMGAQFSGNAYFMKTTFKEYAHFNDIKIKKNNSFAMIDTYFYNVSGLFEFIEENENIFKELRKRSRTLKTEFLPKKFELILGERTTTNYPVQSRQIKDDMYLLDKRQRISRMHGIKGIWHRSFFLLWWLFANYGRSFWRWAAWSFGFALTFAVVFYLYFLESPSSFQTVYVSEGCPFFSFFYYSVVTFTTLGFGDIVPKCGWLQMWVMLEVILGYIMLGGLISILANKLARRS
jgi:hypothetical protein